MELIYGECDADIASYNKDTHDFTLHTLQFIALNSETLTSLQIIEYGGKPSKILHLPTMLMECQNLTHLSLDLTSDLSTTDIPSYPPTLALTHLQCSNPGARPNLLLALISSSPRLEKLEVTKIPDTRRPAISVTRPFEIPVYRPPETAIPRPGADILSAVNKHCLSLTALTLEETLDEPCQTLVSRRVPDRLSTARWKHDNHNLPHKTSTVAQRNEKGPSAEYYLAHICVFSMDIFLSYRVRSMYCELKFSSVGLFSHAFGPQISFHSPVVDSARPRVSVRTSVA